MHWTKDHDILLVREVLAIDPFSEPKGSRERSSLWEEIAHHFNAVSDPKFTVTARSVRDRVNLVLIRKYEKKIADEEKASGIEVDPPSEFDNAMEEICEKAASSDKEQQNLSQGRKEKIDKEKKEAEEIRNKALEKVGETRKRQQLNEGSTEDVKPGKRMRRSGNEAVEYLKEQSKFKKEELQLQREAQASQEKRQDEMSRQLLLQQQQQQTMFSAFQEQQQQQFQQLGQMQLAMMNQQQQQTQALFAVLKELVKK